MLIRFLILSCVPVCFSLSSWADNFPQFRGVGGIAVAPDQTVPQSWSLDQNLAWKVKVPGSGWSQPVVWGENLYVTAAVGEQELKPKDFAGGVRTPQSMGITAFAKAPDMQIEWTVFCIDRRAGTIRWKTSVVAGKPKYPVHPSNTYATESPVADENGVYAFFGATGTVARITHDGSLRWKKELGAFKTGNSFGTGSSIAIDQDRIFVQHFTEESADVHCFATDDGESLWQVSRANNSTSWSSPIIWNNEQRRELVVSGGNQVDSFDLATGEKFWTVTNIKAATSCSPCWDSQRLYFGGSDPFSKGPLFAVSAGADGDLSPSGKNESFEHCDWLVERAGPGMASPASSGQYVYAINNNIIRCYRASDGEKMYESRLPGLKMVAASPIFIGDKLLIVDERGGGVLLADGPELNVVARGEIDDTFWATPAVADGDIYLRGVEYLYCIRTDS